MIRDSRRSATLAARDSAARESLWSRIVAVMVWDDDVLGLRRDHPVTLAATGLPQFAPDLCSPGAERLRDHEVIPRMLRPRFGLSARPALPSGRLGSHAADGR